MTDAINEAINVVAGAIDTEAADITREVMGDDVPLTENNYGTVMTVLGALPEIPNIPAPIVQAGFLQAMVNNGYPATTAAQLRNLMNLPGQKDAQAILMGMEES